MHIFPECDILVISHAGRDQLKEYEFIATVKTQ
jgi:hypothetical protein